MNFHLNKHLEWINYLIIVVIFHIIGLILLLTNAERNPQIVSFGILSYTLGLRHAFDVDHIAAIDNTIRKLAEQKKEPTGVGFFFSLGHSSVVFIMSIVTIFSIKLAQNTIPQIKEIGSIIGTSVSGVFLIFIGILNLYIWFDIYKFFVGTRRGEFDEEHIDEILLNRGFISHFFSSFYNFINKSWHVYPLGFLFGLGFDTASEVALLAISANVTLKAVPVTLVISLPILFTAGMSLMDTLDGIFMTTAYNWAFSTPLRKIYYNLCVTGISVIAALCIGLIEITQILAPKLGLKSGVWKWIQDLNFNNIGYLLVVLFIISWGLSFLVWKVLRLEKVS